MGSVQEYEPLAGIKIAIDRGGTFTDIWATAPGKPDLVFKLLSVDPGNYADAPTEGQVGKYSGVFLHLDTDRFQVSAVCCQSMAVARSPVIYLYQSLASTASAWAQQ